MPTRLGRRNPWRTATPGPDPCGPPPVTRPWMGGCRRSVGGQVGHVAMLPALAPSYVLAPHRAHQGSCPLANSRVVSTATVASHSAVSSWGMGPITWS